jgi:hypothetical protein
MRHAVQIAVVLELDQVPAHNRAHKNRAARTTDEGLRLMF